MGSNQVQTHFTPSAVLHYARYLVPLIVLGLAVHLVLPQIASLERSYQVIKEMLIWAVCLAIIAQVLSYVGSGYILKAIVSLSGGVFSLVRGSLIVLAATSLGMVAGGIVGNAAATYRWMNKEGVVPQEAGLAGTIPGFFYGAVMILVSLIGLINLLIIHQVTRFQEVGFSALFLLLLIAVGLIFWGLQHRPWLMQIADRLGRRYSNLFHQAYSPEKTEQTLQGLFSSWDALASGGWRGPLLGAVLNVAFDMLTLNFLFIAARHPVSLGILLTGYGLPLLLGKMAFFIPGGVGVVESTMTSLFVSLGVPNSEAVVVVLTYRILSFWLPLILGFPLILVMERNTKIQSDNRALI